MLTQSVMQVRNVNGGYRRVQMDWLVSEGACRRDVSSWAECVSAIGLGECRVTGE